MQFTDSSGKPFGGWLPDMNKRLVPSIEPPLILWRALKGIKHNGVQLASSQELFMACKADHVLFHGTRGPGKTDAQIMLFRSMVGKGYGPFWRGIIFDRRYNNLDDLIAKAKRHLLKFNDGCKFLSSKGDLKFVWPTGEELLFRNFACSDDYWSYHGQEYTYIGWNELTKYATSEFYESMMSCNRSGFSPIHHSPDLTKEDHLKLQTVDYSIEDFGATYGIDEAEAIKKKLLPPIPLWVRSTTNPYGPGRSWVKKRFIDDCPPGTLKRITTNVFNPRTQKRENVVKTQAQIFGCYKENIYLDANYVADLENITDPNKREAWLYGNWNISAGGAFDDLWRNDVHKIPRFPIPSQWAVHRTLDWGSTHPFSVGFWAICDGSEAVLPDGHPLGKTWGPPKGTVIRIAEWYGCARDHKNEPRFGENVGVMMSSTDVAKGINHRVELLRERGWINGPVYDGPADNEIRNIKDSGVSTIETNMAEEGVTWEQSDKTGGSRKIGVQLMRDRLQASVLKEGPGFYCFDNCKAFLSIVPELPRDEDDMDDVDTTAEDHPWDETRYFLLRADYRAARNLKVTLAH